MQLGTNVELSLVKGKVRSRITVSISVKFQEMSMQFHQKRPE